MPEVAHAVGDRVADFDVRRVEALPHMGSIAYELEHAASGARMLHVHNHDSENLFSIALRTLADDDTGTPHILEHSVLSGSKKFPVKDPFVIMTRMSMATFINAMTGIDYTVYPVASNVHKDLFNLADVYWDAVFHPALTPETFKQEGHHLDFVDRADPASPLVISGVVYNEMKGAYSVPERCVSQHMLRALFPDTPYGLSSGGDPSAIPDLTYEAFVDFYRRYYRPENAYIFVYGDIPTTEYAAFVCDRLNGYAREDLRVDAGGQPRWSEPRRTVCDYPVASSDPIEQRTFHEMAWLTGDSLDVHDVLRLGVVGELLVGTTAAPLHRALIESKLGENLTASSFFTFGLDSGFLVGLKGSEPDRCEAFERVVLETLERCARDGFAQEQIDAAFHQFAYVTLEINARYPLTTAMNAYSLWLHGADPLGYLRAQETLDTIRDEIRRDPGLVSRLVRERLLENPHRLTITGRPDPGLSLRRDEELAELLAERRAALTDDDLARIRAEALELERLQDTPNTEEALATLPRLHVSDLPKRPKHIPTSRVEVDDGLEILRNDVFSNGVDYLRLSVDLAALPAELWSYVPLFGRCVAKMGAAGDDYVRMAERTAASTGALWFTPGLAGHATDPDACVRRGTFAMKTLDDRVDAALGVLRDRIFELDLEDRDRLRDVILQEKASFRTQAGAQGHIYATRMATSGYGAMGGLMERVHGATQPRLALALSDHFDERVDETVACLERIRSHLLEARTWTASFTGSAAAYDRVEATLVEWNRARRRGDADPVAPMSLALPEVKRQGLAAPVDVAYCATAMPAPHASSIEDVALEIGGLMLARGHLWDEVRAKGGAYGVRCAWSGASKWWAMSSYRDPRIEETLALFAEVADHVRGANWSSDEIERTIIAGAKDAEQPIRPESATDTALWRYLQGATPEFREERHAAMLRLDTKTVQERVLATFDAGMPFANVAVVASRERLEQAGLPVDELMG